MKDYYRILEISPSASVEVIKASYRALAKKYHPDTQISSNIGKTMADINEAYETLSNPQSRKEYDQQYSRFINSTKSCEKSHSYTFSVVSLDSEIYVTGAYVESADELDELGILGQFDRDFGHGDTVHAEISYYIIGQSGVESERLPDEFECDIVSHLDAAVQYADLLEERPLTIDFGDYDMSFE